MAERLPPQVGEWIDRSQPVEFEFEGERYRGFRGDVLASALWAAGAFVMGRSFKYHRPRSIYSLAGHDANFIVQTADQPNARGDLLPITPGLTARAVNTSGGLKRDRYRIMQRFSRFLPVGFYYKAFHTPRRLFPFYERQMRAAAGLGRIVVDSRTPPSPKDYDFCDCLVVGTGASGLSAALAAAAAGLKVLAVDEQARPGGSLCWEGERTDLLRELLAKAEALPNLRIRTGTRAAGWYADQWVALVDGVRLTKLRTCCTIFATGCIEQPAVFQNNDLPGVMLASAACRLMRLYAVRPFNRALVLTANDDGYRSALALAAVGGQVAAIVDLRTAPPATAMMAAVVEQGIKIMPGHAVRAAVGSRKGECLQSVVVAPHAEGRGLSATGDVVIECDGLMISVGWAPNSNLVSQAGGKFRYDPAIEQLVPDKLPAGVMAVGRLSGYHDLEGRLNSGACAGAQAARALGKDVRAPLEVPRSPVAASHPYPIFDHAGHKNFVDFDEDLHLADFEHSHQEGYDNIELLKRYSTVGMGPSQGKLANMNAVRILARLNGKTIDETGTTTGRPFYQPVSIALLAGRRFHPHRHTPIHEWHRANGGVMAHAGAWFRPEYYARPGVAREDRILQEAQNVRENVGIIDISTLTKIQLLGGKAAEFLERIYTGKFKSQKPGSARYAVACDEAGVLIEEGLVARLADDRFYVTASTAGGEAFFREMRRWAILWKMGLGLANITGQWGAINVAGPKARQLLSSMTSQNLAPDAFPAAGVREATVAGVPAVIIRSGFVGELSFELHVPATNALKVWKELMQRGAALGLAPFGTETQRLLRLEKGHLIAGLDTDALTTPFEANLGGVLRFDKPYFVGKRSLEIHRRAPIERLLVGVEFARDAAELPLECQLIIARGEIAGRITSMAPKSTLGKPIAMAFVRPEAAKPGTSVHVRTSPSQLIEATVVQLPFYDPEGVRQL